MVADIMRIQAAQGQIEVVREFGVQPEAAARQSIENAVYRASPLPAPPSPGTPRACFGRISACCPGVSGSGLSVAVAHTPAELQTLLLG